MTSENLPTKEHLYQIDLIRLLSAVAIVTIHASDPLYKLFGKIDNPSWLPFMVLNQIPRFGTPLFVMISGYLLLNSRRLINVKDFYRRRLNRLLLPFLAWNIIYYLLDKLTGARVLDLSEFFERFYNGGTYYHLYFLDLILGLYLITPLLQKVITKPIFTLLVPVLLFLSNAYLIATTWFWWPQLNQLPTWFILYIGYYLAGIWASRRQWGTSRWLLLLIPLCLFLATVGDYHFISRFGLTDQGAFLSHRLSLLTAIPSLIIFFFLIRAPSSFLSILKIFPLDKLANLTMGVYLIHPAIIDIFLLVHPFASLLSTHPYYWFVLTILSTIILSFTLVRLFKTLPLLSRLV
ncbi:acyltransferase family protein [Patescibacteria group bacterium]|nr:acyltransferase family protein [Patescibacteria group bacterium]